jgi:hypothetical protein
MSALIGLPQSTASYRMKIDCEEITVVFHDIANHVPVNGKCLPKRASVVVRALARIFERSDNHSDGQILRNRKMQMFNE